MRRYKVVVYAIAKNEAKFAEKWAKNMNEADEIIVLLDPTSTDGTKGILERNGVKVVEKQIKPWRFDVARNESLKLVPKDADICVCTDLDEIFTPGWRRELERKWKPDTNQAVYKYYHNANFPNMVPNIFDYSKIHDRHSFKWKWAVHEYIMPIKENMNINQVFLDDVMLKHYPDTTKPRTSYRKLLELGVKEDKKDTRYLGLLIEECVNSKEYDRAKMFLKRLYSMKNLSDYDICLYYKFQIRIACELEDFELAKKLCYEALSKCTYCKLFYGELGKICINQDKDYEYGIAMLKKCLSIEIEIVTARETEWNDKSVIYCYISYAYYQMKDLDKAMEYIDMAIKESPRIELYQQNKAAYIYELQQKKKY